MLPKQYRLRNTRFCQRAVALAWQPGASHLPGYHAVQPATQLPSLAEIQERLSKRYGADNAAPGLPSLLR